MKNQKTCKWCLLLAFLCLAVPSYGAETTWGAARIMLRHIAPAMASLPEESRLPIFNHWGITSSNFSDDMTKNRIQIKKMLENLRTPVQGLIKKYNRPFSPYTQNTPDAHEALSEDDFVIGTYGQNGEIILIDAPRKGIM